MNRYLRLLTVRLAALAAFAIAMPAALAQGVTGSAVTGIITEEGTGAPMEGAVVTLRNPSTGDSFNTITDSTGRYNFDNVAPGGPYTLTSELSGYHKSTQSGIQLTLGARLSLDVIMRFQIEEIVIVEQIDPLQDQGRTGPSTTVKDTAISRLPLQGRNFTDLISTAPQVSGNSIAGQNNRYNNIQIDGGANNDLFGLANNGTPGGQANAKPISIEAIKEFVVQIAPFDVRQGSFTGGLVNAITKSGTNDFHGSAFGYIQNKALAGDRGHDAGDIRTTQDDILGYHAYQFGASVGGPIVKDKVHFFVSGDFQVRESAFGSTTQISGSDSAADIAKAGFDNAIAERFEQILASKYQITNQGNALAPELSNPDRNVFAKVTTTLIKNSRLELSYNFVDAGQDVLARNATSPALPTSATSPGRLRDGYQLSNSGYEQANQTNTGRVKMTSNWGKWSNELLAGFSVIRDKRQMAEDLPLILVKVGRIGASDSWLAAGGERFSHQNLLDQNVYQVQDNVTLAIQRHRLTLGTSNEFFNIRNVFFQAAFGAWAFNSLDDFEAGKAAAFQRRFGVSDMQAPGTADFNVAQLGFYVQDEWQLLDNLALTPGFRVDIPFLSAANANPVLLNNTAFPIDTSEVPSGNPLFSPRVGFNWDLDGHANTIVRGGVGVFTGRPPYVWVSNAYSINGLSQVELTCVGTTGVPAFTTDPNAQPSDCMGGTGTPTAPMNQGEIDYFDKDTRYPQNLRFALGVDRKIPLGIQLTGDYLYTQDVNGWYTTDENLKAQAELSGDGRQLYGTFGPAGFQARPERVDAVNLAQAVKVFNKNGGRVHNFTIAAQKTFKKWLDMQVAYTYSNSKDRISLTSSQALSNFQFAPLDGTLDERNVRPSAFDRPHKVTITGVANMPYGFGLGLSYVGQSGLPYTWVVNGDVNADGQSANDLVFVPNDMSQISLDDNGQYPFLATFIDSQGCLKDAKGRFVKRGECRNPWQNFLNVRFTWTSPQIAGQRLEFQWDIFNIMNIFNSEWGLVDTATGFETHGASFLRAVGYDTTNKRPIYHFNPPADATGKSTVVQTIYTPNTSRWRMQFGLKYTF